MYVLSSLSLSLSLGCDLTAIEYSVHVNCHKMKFNKWYTCKRSCIQFDYHTSSEVADGQVSWIGMLSFSVIL